MTEKLVILGAGGHAAALYDMLKDTEYLISAVCTKDENQSIHKSLLGIPIVIQNDLTQIYGSNEVVLVNGVGKVNTDHTRDDIFIHYKNIGYDFLTVTHEMAFVSGSCTTGEGVHIMMGAHLGANVEIGYNCIINSMSSIDHDCVLGNNVHVAPGVIICGGVIIEDGVTIGAGSTILPGVRIQRGSFIKAQSMISKRVENQC